MKVRKGYSLIELIVVIAIITVLLGMFSHFYYSYKNYKSKFLSQYCSNNIMVFINTSKQFCNYNKCIGSIIFDISRNKVDFYANGKYIRQFYLPNECKLNSINTKNGRSTIYIDNAGFTSNACTITYKDSQSILHFITISVGTSYVDIKN